MSQLADRYDAALFDLDGVVYLDAQPIDGVVEALEQLRTQGLGIGFVTNNAARSPQTVADHLTSLGITANVSDVVTSSQASAELMAQALEPGARVLIVGAQALGDEIEKVGLAPVWTSDDDPQAVVQGYDPNMTWPRLDDACKAIHKGARWYATNLDSNRPTPFGRVPGAGAQIDAIAAAVLSRPEVAGKPFPPLLQTTVRRLQTQRPVFVGDRLDTDIEGATNVGMESLFVFTGTHQWQDLVEAAPALRPTHIGFSVDALTKPARQVDVRATQAQCANQIVEINGGQLVITSTPATLEEELDALWAGLQLVWANPGTNADAFAELSYLN